MSKSLDQLKAYEARLETDLRRSQHLQPGAIGRNSPLVRNLEQVRNEIANFKPETSKTEVLSEQKVDEAVLKPGSKEHMEHAVRMRHFHGVEHPHYHIHHVGVEKGPDEQGQAYPLHHYLVIHKHAKETDYNSTIHPVHHFWASHSPKGDEHVHHIGSVFGGGEHAGNKYS